MPVRQPCLACIAALIGAGSILTLAAPTDAWADRPAADTLLGSPSRYAPDSTPSQPPLTAGGGLGARIGPQAQLPLGPAGPARSDSQGGEFKPIEGGQIVARVGSEVVLAADVLVGWDDFLAQNGDRIPASQRDQLRRMFMKRQLEQLVETKLIFAHARQTIPAENFPKIEETLGKKFDEERVPQLMKLTKTSLRGELDAKLHSMGTSLARRRQAFTETVMAQQWLRQEIQSDAEITYDELWEYYQEHLTDFDIKARVRWEEIVARFDRFPSRKDARAAIEQWGDDVWYRREAFAAVARKHSHGITSDDGGRYDWTTQGSLRSEVVDQALSSLPVGTLSKILEDDAGYRIVRVIERQAAGRTPFAEAQAKIREQITRLRRKDQVRVYIDRLRDTTPMWTAFDDLPDRKLQ